LFLERAEDLDPAFVPTQSDLMDIGAICRQLDGLPLAIELAAAKTRILKVAEIRRRLREKFALLSAGPGQTTPRHQTVRTAIEHSYQLLNENDRRAFDSLSIFEGSWSIEAAEHVLTASGIDDPLSTIQDLYDYSLLVKESGTLSNRYRFLETIREFAKEIATVEPDIQSAFCQFYVGLAERLGELYKQGNAGEANLLARADHGNVRSALDLYLQGDSWEEAAQLVYYLRDLWIFDSRIEEGSRIYDNLASRRPCGNSTLVAKTLNVAGVFAWIKGDFESARTFLGESLAVWHDLGDAAQVGNVHNNLGLLESGQGDYGSARSHFKKSLAAARLNGDKVAAAKSLTNLGVNSLDNGEFDVARRWFEQASIELTGVSDEMTMGTLLANIAFASVSNGDPNAGDLLSQAIQYELLHERAGLAYRLLLVSSKFVHDNGDNQFAKGLLGAAIAAHEGCQSAWRKNEESLIKTLTLQLAAEKGTPLPNSRMALEGVLDSISAQR
jgi:tetratricopeptide (TPR) repeat protein